MIQIDNNLVDNKFSINCSKHKENSPEISSKTTTINTKIQSNQQMINNRFCSQSITPNNSSRIVINCNSSFKTLRIEDPKKVTEETNDIHVKTLLNNIPSIGKQFWITGLLGEGTFSKVYKAKNLMDDKDYALKYVIPTIKPSRIASELRYLRDLGGDKNIIKLTTCLFDSGHTVIVMPIFPHQKFTDYVSHLTVSEVRDYMKNLMIALEKVHSYKIIHRDVKPANFLYDRKNRKYALVDFGLAQTEKEILNAGISSGQILSHAMRIQSIGKKEIKYKTKTEIKNDLPKRPVLNDCTSSATNKSSVKKDSKWQIRKRSRNEAQLNERPGKLSQPKKQRVEVSKEVSSVFNSPLTPTVFKSPTNESELKNDIIKTPDKDMNALIPETPPKTAMKAMEINASLNNKSKNEMLSNQVIETPKSRYKNRNKKRKSVDKNVELMCDCLATNKVCTVCKSKPELNAPRAGTPGFRAPEVLFKYLFQTTAIDIWSSGVIFASLLTGRYPFFRNIDDMTSLAEIITVLGTKRVRNAAKALGKSLNSSPARQAVNLKELCQKLKFDKTFEAPDSAYDLLNKLLEPNPYNRFSASEALKHEFFTSDN